MNMERFFASLTQWGISIHLDENGAIRVKGKKEKLTASVVAQLKANKTQIAQWLAQSQPTDEAQNDGLKEDSQALCESLTTAQQEAFEQLTLHGLFEVQALEYAERDAIEFAGLRLSYGQLNLQANRLAYYLRQQGLESESCVAIAMEPSVDCIIAILAVLKSGGAFLPIDPNWSESFLHGMLNDGEVCRILTDNTFLSDCEFLPLPVDNLDDEHLKVQLLECAGVNPPMLETQSAFSLATILATSAVVCDDEEALTEHAQTEQKGVMLEHGNLLNSIKYGQLPEIEGSNCWGLNFPLTSRFGLMSLFMALCHGGKLVQFSPFNDSVTRQLTHLCVDGEQLGLLLHHNQTLIKQVRHLMVVGHQFDHQLLLQLMAVRTLPTIRLYGLLEAGFFVGSTLLDSNNPMLIGQINKGSSLYLLDEQMQQVGESEQGQIYLAGLAVSRGYSQGWQLTEQYFIPSPFSDDPNEHLIATGDVATLNAEQLTFLNRLDQKVYSLPSDWSSLPSHWASDSGYQSESSEQSCLKQTVWHNAPYSTVAQKALPKGVSYVVFVDGFGVGNQLLTQLRRAGINVVEVRIGEQFAMLRSGVYQLNPANSDDYHTLFNYLFQLGTKRCAVVHCWSLTLIELNAFSEAIFERLGRIEQYQQKGALSIQGVINGVNNSEIDCVELSIVSHDLHSVTGLESLLLSASDINALVALNTGINSYQIDLTIEPYQLDDARLHGYATFIMQELMVADRQKFVAFRGRHRWLPSDVELSRVIDDHKGEPTNSRKNLIVVSDDAKALSVLVDGLSVFDSTHLFVLSDEVEIVNGTWPENVECLHTLLGDFNSIERRLAQVSKDSRHIDTCIFLPSSHLSFEKQVKTLLSLESLFSVYKVDSCVLVSPLASLGCQSAVEQSALGQSAAGQTPLQLPNGSSCHAYHQLFVQAQFAKFHGDYACIGYGRVEQLSERVFVDGLLAPRTCYGFLA